MNNRKQKQAIRRISRRGFLKTLAVSGGAAAGASFLTGCGGQTAPAAGGNPSAGLTLDLTKPENQALASVGGTLALAANNLDAQGLLLYRSSDTTVLVFSRKCTHMGCTIGEFQGAVSTCPCHGSQFDTGGKVVRGPAQNPLRQYTATVSGTTVTISA
jgi:Rieske Fe-S protein